MAKAVTFANLIAALVLAWSGSLRAQTTEAPALARPPAGSTGFCLFEVPSGVDRRQWVNLAHVQYIEHRNDDVRFYFGGGNFGSGHEVRIPAKSAEEAGAILQKLKREAARCAGS